MVAPYAQHSIWYELVQGSKGGKDSPCLCRSPSEVIWGDDQHVEATSSGVRCLDGSAQPCMCIMCFCVYDWMCNSACCTVAGTCWCTFMCLTSQTHSLCAGLVRWKNGPHCLQQSSLFYLPPLCNPILSFTVTDIIILFWRVKGAFFFKVIRVSWKIAAPV